MSDKTEAITLHPIGSISTPFQDRYDAPRQPGVEEPQIGIITLNRDQNFEQALQDLAGFEKIWLIYLFDRNPNWKPKVMPPRGSHVKRGVFATRSPHRPNPIGLSLVDLVQVKGRTVKVRGVDLLDGTPILDIKPYLSFIESFPSAKAGWLDASEQDKSSGSSSTEHRYTIDWTPLAREQAEYLLATHRIDLITRTEKILSEHPEPHPYRRIKKAENDSFVFASRSWRLRFTLHGKRVRIERLLSGYTTEELRTQEKSLLHDAAAHSAFHERWKSE